QGGPPVEEYDAEEQYHQEQAEQQRHGQVVGGRLDERGRPEHPGVDGDAAELGLQRPQCFLDVPGDLQGVCSGELLHDEHQAATAVDHRVADERLVVLDDLGHVTEAQRLVGGVFQPYLGEVLRGTDGQ